MNKEQFSEELATKYYEKYVKYFNEYYPVNLFYYHFILNFKTQCVINKILSNIYKSIGIHEYIKIINKKCINHIIKPNKKLQLIDNNKTRENNIKVITLLMHSDLHNLPYVLTENDIDIEILFIKNKLYKLTREKEKQEKNIKNNNEESHVKIIDFDKMITEHIENLKLLLLNNSYNKLFISDTLIKHSEYQKSKEIIFNSKINATFIFRTILNLTDKQEIIKNFDFFDCFLSSNEQQLFRYHIITNIYIQELCYIVNMLLTNILSLSEKNKIISKIKAIILKINLLTYNKFDFLDTNNYDDLATCMYNVNGVDNNRNATYLVCVNPMLEQTFLQELNSDVIHLEQYSTVLCSFYSEDKFKYGISFKKLIYSHIKKDINHFKKTKKKLTKLNIDNEINILKNFNNFDPHDDLKIYKHDFWKKTKLVNKIYDDDYTVFMKFVLLNNKTVVNDILQNDNHTLLNYTNKQGINALTIAAKYGYHELYDIINEKITLKTITCNICFEKDIKYNFTKLSCCKKLLHNKCIDNLRRHICPFCRQKFTKNKSNLCIDLTSNYENIKKIFQFTNKKNVTKILTKKTNKICINCKKNNTEMFNSCCDTFTLCESCYNKQNHCLNCSSTYFNREHFDKITINIYFQGTFYKIENLDENKIYIYQLINYITKNNYYFKYNVLNFDFQDIDYYEMTEGYKVIMIKQKSCKSYLFQNTPTFKFIPEILNFIEKTSITLNLNHKTIHKYISKYFILIDFCYEYILENKNNNNNEFKLFNNKINIKDTDFLKVVTEFNLQFPDYIINTYNYVFPTENLFDISDIVNETINKLTTNIDL